MKKIYNLSLLVLFFTFITSCEKDFDEINTSTTSATQIDPAFILNNAVINSSVVTLIYEIGVVQQIISPNSGVLTGANYNQDNRATTDDNWASYYRNVIKNTKDVISRTKDDPTRSNLMNMARILQAYAFMVLTDSYGDIPYAEGGEGYFSQIFFPVYETQQTIYPKIIAELTDATAALSASGKIETADILYGGDVAKWKKFGYSLLLRAGMRLSAVDATQAQAAVKKAFDGGVIISNSDNASVRHDANYKNPISNTLNSTEAANYYLTKPFVDALKSTNDPRLVSIAVRYIGASSGSAQIPANASIKAADQIGIPMGKDNATATCKVLCGGNDAVLSAFSAGINKPGDVLYISGTCDIMMVCLDNPKGSAGYNIRSHILPGLWLTLFVLNTGGKSLEWFQSVFCSEMTADQFYKDYIPSVIENKIDEEAPSYEPFLQGSRYSVHSLKAGFSGIDVNTTRDDFLMALLKGNNLYLASHLSEVSPMVKLNPNIKLTGGAGNIRNMDKVKKKWIGDYRFEYIDQSSLQGAAKLGKLYFENLNI